MVKQMFRLLGKIPKEFYIAVSGGIDSMVLLDFLLNANHRPKAVLYFNHGTEYGKMCSSFLKERCEQLNLKLIEGMITTSKSKYDSQEEYWRNERYAFFKNYECVMTAHHIDDVLEWWIFSSLHGQSKLIPYKRDNIIRPFLMVTKRKIKQWAEKHNVIFIDDPSNKDTKYMRNHIRSNMVDNALIVNPGLRKVLTLKIKEDYINNHK